VFRSLVQQLRHGPSPGGRDTPRRGELRTEEDSAIELNTGENLGILWAILWSGLGARLSMGLGLGLWTYCNDPRFLGKGSVLGSRSSKEWGRSGMVFQADA
jgi:hypothetical protein